MNHLEAIDALNDAIEFINSFPERHRDVALNRKLSQRESYNLDDLKANMKRIRRFIETSLHRGFFNGVLPKEPYAYIQWEKTDTSMDFFCECGAQFHSLGKNSGVTKCLGCDVEMELPIYLMPRPVDQSRT